MNLIDQIKLLSHNSDNSKDLFELITNYQFDKNELIQIEELAFRVSKFNFKFAVVLFEYLIFNKFNISLNYYHLALIYENNNHLKLALKYYDLAISSDPFNYYPVLNKANILFKQKFYESANNLIDQFLSKNDKIGPLWNLKGLICIQFNLLDDALLFFDCACILEPKNISFLENKALIFQKLGQFKKAISVYIKIIEINSDHFVSHLNLGFCFFNLDNFEQASFYLCRASSINSESYDAWFQLGHVLFQQKNYQSALDAFFNALKINKNSSDLYANIGAIFQIQKDFKSAIEYITHSLIIDESKDFLLGNLSFLNNSIADWSNYDSFCHSLFERAITHNNVIQPFNCLSLTDSVQLQHKISNDWTSLRFPEGDRSFLFPVSANHKIRIGYFSSDFKHHPVSYLIIQLLELANRNKFEIFGFSFSTIDTNSSDAFLNRLYKSFDFLFDLTTYSNSAALEFVRNQKIDIAIDLNGHTQEARTVLFAERLAPIQINYLGFPGTMGSKYHDFIIADPQLIPPEYSPFYSEKIIYLPHLFQVFDAKRVISNKPSKNSLNLPNDKFIFGCFNNTYKITPKIFTSWIKILKEVNNSILWLLQDNQLATNNLKREFNKYGLDLNRLIFTTRTNYEEYLERYQLMDLFLDTFPFNGGTTANDCLWSGTPLITMAGQSYGSRMASSLLKASNLTDLITYSIEEYTCKAIDLGNNPEKIAIYKKQLKEQLENGPSWNMINQTRYIEKAYQNAYEQIKQGQKNLENIIIHE